MLVDVWDVVEAFILMGFTHDRVSGRQHKFVRGPLAIILESTRGIGFEVHHLLQDAATRGILEELETAFQSVDPALYELKPPSSTS